MYQRITSLILRLLKVPPEPQPPLGDPASLRVFRAGKKYFHLKLAGWAFAEALAFAGIIFWAAVFIGVETDLLNLRQSHAAPVSFKDVRDFEEYVQKIGAAQKPEPSAQPAGTEQKAKPRPRVRVIIGLAGFKRMLAEVALWLPLWAFPLLWALKLAGFALYLAQIPFTYTIMRLDYEMRWYVVTDRSLRIRTGVWNIQELTMSFANLQQVEMQQGPLQRLLGLGDVHVQSAGGGGGGHPSQQAHNEALHTGIFHSVDNAGEIRDLILARLRQFRQAGLGDHDDPNLHPGAAPATTATTVTPANTLSAAHELLAEARALRAALSS